MKKKPLLYFIAACMVLTLIGMTLYYWYEEQNYVSTEDAQVDASTVAISSQIAGQILEMNVSEGDLIDKDGIMAHQSGIDSNNKDSSNLFLIKSPIKGVIVKKYGNTGTVVLPGQSIAVVADLDNLYITANIVEGSLSKIKPGQTVDIKIDSFPGVDFSGSVISIGKATASTFALLPSRNTGGNFTKVVQVIPVKIQIDRSLNFQPLPGMNAFVRIHIKQADK
jgi:multidrug resistance efflux pump